MKRPFGVGLSGDITRKQEPSTIKARPVRRMNKERVSLTFNVPPEVYLKLQEIKLARGTSVQGLLEEAVDVWLLSLGETGFRRRGE